MTQCVLVMAWLAGVAAPKVVVLPLSRSPDVPSDVSARLDAALFVEIDERRTLNAARADKLKGTDALATVQTSEVLAQADKALHDGAPDTAARQLEKYISELERAQAKTPIADLADAYLLLSAAQFQRANDDEGQRALDAAVRLRPERELPQGDFPPLFVRLHKAARARLREHSKGELRIEADASNAEVAFNGRAIGTAPVTLQNIPPGTHYISVKLDGRQALRRIESSGGDAKTIRFFLGAGPRRVLGANRFDAREKASLAEVARAENADAVVAGVVTAGSTEWTLHLVMVSPRGEGVVLGHYTVDQQLLSANVEAGKVAERVLEVVGRPWRDESVVAIVPGLVPEPQAVVDVFSTGSGERIITMPTPAPPPSAPPQQQREAPEALISQKQGIDGPLVPLQDEPTVEPSKPVYKRWWFWTIIGVAVVGGAAATTAAVLTAKVDRVSVSASW